MNASAKPPKQKAAKAKSKPAPKVKPGPKPPAATKARKRKSPGAAARAKAAPAPAVEAVPPPRDEGAATGAEVLDRLWAVVQARRNADPGSSHSARLLGRGTAKVAQKFGEEAVEAVIEAVAVYRRGASAHQTPAATRVRARTSRAVPRWRHSAIATGRPVTRHLPRR